VRFGAALAALVLRRCWLARGAESLTPGERRVAELAGENMTDREIAQALLVTPNTVERHLSAVYRKLGIASRAELVDALGVPA